jgi:hypothetical protein
LMRKPPLCVPKGLCQPVSQGQQEPQTACGTETLSDRGSSGGDPWRCA